MDRYASFETENGSRYLLTLCKHFGRRSPVRFDAQTGFIELPFSSCALKVSGSRLNLSVSAETKPDLDRATQAVTSHLERFAFRENPDLKWNPMKVETQNA